MIRRFVQDESGQASVEYVLVGTVIMVFVSGLAALWRYASGASGFGTVQYSHVLDMLGGVADVLLY